MVLTNQGPGGDGQDSNDSRVSSKDGRLVVQRETSYKETGKNFVKKFDYFEFRNS